MAFSISSGDGVFDGESSEDSDMMASSKRVRQVKDKRSSWSKMDMGLWSTLDDNLVEKIVARLPFKYLFRASSLSKTWSLKFLSRSFQSEVLNSTSTWTSYAPVFVNVDKELVGFEGVSQRWYRLPTHSYVPKSELQGWCLRAASGALLCWTAIFIDAGTFTYHVYVSNPLTRSWKQLPARPTMRHPAVVHVTCQGSKAYQVILVSFYKRRDIHVQIFDSTSNSWTVAFYNSETNLDAEWISSAYMNGVVYLAGPIPGPRCLYSMISFNVKEKTWKEIPRLCAAKDNESSPNKDDKDHQPLEFFRVHFSRIVVCGSDVILVVLHRNQWSIMDFDFDDSSNDDFVRNTALSVFRLDLESGLAFEVSRAPTEMLIVPNKCSAIGQGDSVYIGGYPAMYQSIVYKVEAQEWHWVPSASDQFGVRLDNWMSTMTTYQPSLNPFLVI